MSKALRTIFVCFSMLLLISTQIHANNCADLLSEKFVIAKRNSLLLLSDFGADYSSGRKSNTTVIIGGVGLAASYVATVVTGLAIAESWGGAGSSYYLIPVIGPFLQIPETGSPYTELCILSGVAQTGFFAVLVYGLIKNKKPNNDASLRVVWAPIVSKNTSGILLRLRF